MNADASRRTMTVRDDLLETARDTALSMATKQAILQCCRKLDPEDLAPKLNTRIHANDPMFMHSLREHADVGAALAQYFNIAAQQYNVASQIVDALFGDDGARQRIKILDFACGYGRLLRFMTLAFPTDPIYASELQHEALDFVVKAFGVHAIVSCTDPAWFAPDERFDFIWVASLFSHLPEPLFTSWLEKLYSLLSPTGVLCFSTRDASLLAPPRTMPSSGFMFDLESEDVNLNIDIYGTTYVTPEYVREAARHAAGDDVALFRLPRCLANEQDLYVISMDRDRNLQHVASIRRGVWGWVDRRHLSEAGELHLEGWAASTDGEAGLTVEISVDGGVYNVQTGIRREDVGAALMDSSVSHAGWSFRHKILQTGFPTPLLVTCRTANSCALLYMGDLSPAFHGARSVPAATTSNAAAER